MAKWVCTVCGYVYEGENPPAECPVCHVGADKFKKVEGDLILKSLMKIRNTSSSS